MKPISIKLAIYVGIGALALGLSTGGYVAHAFYGPQLEAERLKVSSLGEKIEAQNDSIEKLKQASDTREATAKRAIKDAEEAVRKADSDALELMSIRLPLGANQCEAASALITKELAK